MTCPKCDKEVEEVTEELKRVVTINRERESFIDKNVPDYLGWGIIISALMFFPLGIGFIIEKIFPNSIIAAYVVTFAVVIFSVSMFAGALLDLTLGKWQRKKAEQEFLKKFSDKAEILEKAKGEEK